MNPPELRPELLAILRCPKCKGGLVADPTELSCHTCGLAYAVQNGIPNMLIEEARTLPKTAAPSPQEPAN
jgi:uncharacterized protein YbaR (Trm112 family)